MLRYFPLLALMFALSGSAWAKIYMYVDSEGRKGATDRREAIPPGAKITSVVDMGGGADSFSAPKKSGGGKFSAKVPTPAHFPRIDSGTQRKRDDVRRTILEEEMAIERKQLEQARSELAAGTKPLAGENAASPAYVARLKKLREAVQSHERNLAAIQKELGTAR